MSLCKPLFRFGAQAVAASAVLALTACGSNESVGIAAAPLQADLVAVPHSGHHSLALPHETFDFTASIRNRGGADARSFAADLFHGHVKLAHQQISHGLAAGQARALTFEDVPAGGHGPMRLTMVLDPGDRIEEADEGNNRASYTVLVQQAGIAALYPRAGSEPDGP